MDAKSWLTGRKGHFLAFVLAFALAWLIFRPTAPSESAMAAAVILPPDQVRDFLAAVGRNDFAAMRNFGERLFRPGAALGSAEADLTEYETNGFPPQRVFLFHSGNGEGNIRRVILTLDNSNRVLSFLAEETRIVN